MLKPVLQAGVYIIKKFDYPHEASETLLTYADGIVRYERILLEQVDICVLHKSIKPNLIILPELQNNRTLLGVDFL